MSAKRSRPDDSSNSIEKDLRNHMSSPFKYAREACGASDIGGKPPKCLKLSVDEGNKEQLWKNAVLKTKAHESISGGIGSFLKYCYYCKNEIDQKEDIFMYRDLCAFCSEDCRNYQIEIDEKTQRQSEESSGVVQEEDMNNSMNDYFLNR